MNDLNISFAWSKLIIHELKVNHVTDFVIAPGSRSAPLTIACAEDKDVTKHVHLDERGIGFFALGLAKAKRKPVAIITTSGTAVANLYPAVIEAYMTNVPLIIISADRPAELYSSGSNQTIIQQDIFNKYAKCISLIEPNTRVAIKSLLTKIDHLVFDTVSSKKPIQLNCPLFKPLYPDEKGEKLPVHWINEYVSFITSKVPAESIYDCCYSMDTALYSRSNLSEECDNLFLFIIGNNVSTDYHDKIRELAEKLNAVVFADLQSGYPYDRLTCHDLFVGTNKFSEFSKQITAIIQFGNQLISSRLLEFKNNFNGLQVTVSDTPDEQDPNFNSSKQFVGIAQFLSYIERILPTLKLKKCTNTINELKQKNTEFSIQFSKMISKDKFFNELSASLAIADTNADVLFIGNSLCCRTLDLVKFTKKHHFYTNRGASGIDGIIATACGISAHYGQCTLVIGDISALHDLSSFMLLQKYKVRIIVYNNHGGNIFALLKSKNENPYLADYFELNHNISFSSIAQMFNIAYKNIKTINDFNSILRNNGETSFDSCIIECDFENELGVNRLRQITKELLYSF